MLGWGYLLVMLPLGVGLAMVAALRRDGLPERVMTFVFATAIAFSLLLLVDRISSITWLILALGIGVRCAAWAARRPETMRRMRRQIAATGAIGYMALTLWATAGRSIQERRVLAALGEATGATNVLLIILDTVTATDLGIYGNSRPTTPRIDDLAREGVLFEQAFAPAPWTLPSHASMFTGLWPSQHSADWEEPLGPDAPTVAEIFRAQGFATGGFTANLIATGDASGLARGFVTYRATRRTLQQVALHSTLAQGTTTHNMLRTWQQSRWLGGVIRRLRSFDFRPDNPYQVHHPKGAPQVTDDFLDWQENLGSRPFFAFLNYFDAHAPYESPLGLRFDEGRTPRDRHEGALRYIDDEVSRVLSQLQTRGVLDHTIVVVTADHGEQFGEHGLKGHGNSLYRPLLHVPLIVRFPEGQYAGTRVPASVSTRDLAPTLVSLAGIASVSVLGGASLESYLLGAERLGRQVLAKVSQGVGNQAPRNRNVQGPIHGVIDDTLHIVHELGRDCLELFRYREDPKGERNLVTDAAQRVPAYRYLRAVRRAALPEIEQADSGDMDGAALPEACIDPQ